MSSQFLGRAYLVVLVLVILVLAKTSQKPLCINSQMIEKITMIDGSFVYRCSVRKVVPYSASFVHEQQMIDSKVIAYERWLNQVFQVKVPRLTITISSSPVVTQMTGKNLVIWDQNLKTTLQLEAEMAKGFLRTFNAGYFSTNDLALISLAELIVKIWSANSKTSYNGLATYVAHQWWRAFSDLQPNDKFLFLQNLPSVIESAKAKKLSDIESTIYDQLIQLTSFFPDESRLGVYLKSRNTIEDNSLVASFDYLVLMSKWRPDLSKSLEESQGIERSLNIGFWDGKNLFDVGSKSQTAANAFSKLKVHFLIWETCDDPELASVLSVAAEVKKLLVVRNCSEDNQPDYTSYIKKGVKGFAASHPQISFVQLDLPSLNMRRDRLMLQQRIFELMAQQSKDDGVRSSFLGLFGIEQLNWNQSLQMYSPKAQIDAVESFRIIKTN